MGAAWHGSHSHGFPKPTRAAILQRDPTCRCTGCRRCNHGCTQPSVVADHRTPVAEGGTDDPSNGQGLCQPCSDVKTQAEAARGRARNTTTRTREPHPGIL